MSNRYRVKFQKIVYETSNAVLVKTWDNRDVWLPSRCVSVDFKYTKGIAYIIPEWLCVQKGLDGKLYEPFHRPEKIEPVYNQEAIDELKL